MERAEKMSFRFLCLAFLGCFVSHGQPPEPHRYTRDEYPHPGWKPTPKQVAMPKSTLIVDEHLIQKAKYPAIDIHFHGGRVLNTPADYAKLISIMDQVGVGMIVNLDGGFGQRFDQNMKSSAPYRDRIIEFARLNWEGVNEPGWSEKMAAELERCFRAGAQGLKIANELGLYVKNKDGSFIQCDDPRLDAIWEMCAKYHRPILHHVNEQFGRFLPIDPSNERYEAGLWRDDPSENFYNTGQPGYEEINGHREKMLGRHPNTIFILAHIAMMGFNLKRVGELLDKFPNAHVDLAAAIQEVGRQPVTARKFLVRYQDRVFFGTDGGAGRMDDLDGFWRPHFRFLETEDEYFNHPAQLLSPEGAPLHGRWSIYGVNLPDEVLRKIYYENALRYLPAARPAMEKRLAAR
jgi:predicted TIM-barrel fold metal-dependent hydrolase